ncbi:MAG: MFS transporter [Eggerthellaceae bacterium]|nr:MFS transporter [Eggerthellaceae bacterium]
MISITVALTDMMGWQSSLMVFGIVEGLLSVCGTVFFIAYSPQKKGMKPYGYDPAIANEKVVESGVPTKRAVCSIAFILVAFTLVLTQLVSVINAYFPMYAESVGFSATVGYLMISVALIFDIGLNPLVGWTIDKFGAVKMFCA